MPLQPLKASLNAKIGYKNFDKISLDTFANPLPPPCVICPVPLPQEYHVLFEWPLMLRKKFL